MTMDPGRRVYVSSVPYESERVYAAAIYCSDGRIGDQIDDFLHHGLGLPRYDRVTCPGGPVALSGRFDAFWDARGIDQQLRFLAQVHDVRTVVLITHDGCAYYARRLSVPADQMEAEQRGDLEKATGGVQRLMPNARVRRFFARRTGTEICFEDA
jgi:hypothetical protein